MPDLSPITRLIALWATAALCGGCAALGGGGGGGENLPNRGIAPYVRVGGDDEETPLPYALEAEEPEAVELREPSAVVVDAQVLLYVELRERVGGAASIARASSDASGTSFGPSEPVLDPAEAPEWADGRVGAPSVLRTDGGWLLAFAYGDGAGIGLARSQDGLHFDVDPQPALARDPATEASVDAPSLVRFGDQLVLLYEVLGVEEGATRRIDRALADGDGVSFARAGTALEAGTGCFGADGAEDPCWDRAGVGSPELRVSRTATGRELLRLFYTGYSGKRGDLGFAASFDGVTWSRFAFNPVVAEKLDERGPTNVRFGDIYLLYYVETGSGTAHGIAAARDEAGVPSERF
ncbi:MAG: hypothetical protein H6744_15820 [Deltaproteobacteria bacterium]|nr:hypothetical protein [Deltaproteobacteria bacterium]MCB9788150.1 hypothetical protein [Deltaproteobacteria bacterium]